MPDQSRRGAILFIVLGVFMVVAVLAAALLRTMSSQSRLTHHQVSRIQAQYAAKAGMVFALDQLRRGVWSFSSNSCPNPAGCLVADPQFPPSINRVRIIFCPSGSLCAGSTTPCNPPNTLPPSNQFCINTTTDYLYTP